MDSTSDNKRIAKNTFLLYVRMFLIILVNLYMSRVVLKALGVEDYGLYSVVGSVVAFLGFLNTAMAAASQRFLSFASGKGDEMTLNSTFNSIFVVQFLLGIVILIIGESVGVYYIANYLNVDASKIPTAHMVYQLSLGSFIIHVVTVPYNAAIIANERMDAFALFSILDVFFKLGIAYIILAYSGNRLVFYAAIMLACTVVVQFCYYAFCRVKFKECVIRKNANKKTIKDILSYSGWNLMGSMSAVAIDQGVNMILNSFFGVIVNAARGIAFQVSTAVSQLAGNFMQAINPQIVKSYAKEDFDRMYTLIIQGTRLSYFLLFICAMPLLFCMSGILEVWLDEVPAYTEWFCILVVINCVLSSLAQPLLMGAMATGRIRNYQIIVAFINILNFPLSIIALNLVPDPYVTVYIMIALTIIATIARLIIVRDLIALPVKRYVIKAIRPIVVVSVISVAIASCINHLVAADDGLVMLAVKLILIFIATLLSVGFLGISAYERKVAVDYLFSKLRK